MTVEILDEVGQHVLAYCASNSAWDSYSYGQGQTSAGASIGSGPVPGLFRRGPGRLESGTKWGRLRRERHGVRCSAEAGVPPVEVAGELVVEDAGAALEQEVGAAGVQRICCFLTMRLLITWLTADSVNAVEMASPARWRSS